MSIKIDIQKVELYLYNKLQKAAKVATPVVISMKIKSDDK